MEYASETPNAIILPLPVATGASEEDVSFIDLSHYDDFFVHLAKAFPYIPRRGFGCSAGPDGSVDVAAALPVHSVGNFIASFVPTVEDFDRLDPQFSIPVNTWNKIPKYSDYGFTVFQLAELAGKPHPIAFEFKNRTRELFFPTIHIHDGEVHDREHFDHTLYMQHAGLDSIAGDYINYDVRDSRTRLIRSADVARASCDMDRSGEIIAPELLVHRTDIFGEQKNEDIVYAIEGDPRKVSRSLLSRIRFWHWLIPVLAMSWFFRRRSRLKRNAATGDQNNKMRPPSSFKDTLDR